MSTKTRWGILGTGMIARKFAGELPKSKSGILAATASRGQATAEAFAKAYGGTGVSGYQSLIDRDDVDAVYISLPNHLHKEWTKKCLEAGKHVLCEKPIALHRQDAEDMFECSQATGKILIEAFMYRCTPLARKIIEICQSGQLGELRLIRSNFSFSREANLEDARYHPDKGGGSVMDVGCYCVNLMRAVTGMEPTEINATAHIHEYGVDDYAAGWLKFGDGILATFTSGMTVESDTGTYIAGTRGHLHVDGPWFGENPVHLHIDGQKPETIQCESIPGLYALEADTFHGVIQGHSQPWISKEDTIGNMATLDKIRISAGIPI